MLHVYQGRQLTCSLCFQRAGSEGWGCHDRERRTLALTRRAQTAEHEDGRRTDRSLSMELNLSVGPVHAVAWDLKRAHDVPTGSHVYRYIYTCEGHHMSLSPKHDAFLRWTVEGDKTWCHHSEPKEKSPSMQWRHRTSPRPKKSKPQAPDVKIMLTVFFDTEGLHLFLPSNHAT